MATKDCPECTEEECKKQALERLKQAQEKAKSGQEKTSLKGMLAQKDLIWQSQFNNAMEDIDKKYCITQECFDQLYQEVTKKYKLETGDVCEDNQLGVIECYKEKKSSPLLCQKTVQQYTDCVNETSRSVVEKAAKEDENKKKQAEKKP